MRRSIPFIAVIVVMLGGAAPAGAGGGGGSWLASPKPTHQPGEVVTMVGYTDSDRQRFEGEWVGGPWFGAIAADPFGPPDNTGQEPDWIEVGEAVIEDTSLGGYLSHRVLLEFTLPDDLEPGIYGVSVRNAVGAAPGTMMGGAVAVGIDFDEGPGWFEWPLDEPLVADLPDDAVIAGPGFEVTAGELRRGEYPPGAAQFMLDPSVLPTTTTTTTTTTTSTTSSTTTPVAPTDPAIDEAVQVLTDLGARGSDAVSTASAAGGLDPPGIVISPSRMSSAARWLLVSVLVGGAGWWLTSRLRGRRHRQVPWSSKPPGGT